MNKLAVCEQIRFLLEASFVEAKEAADAARAAAVDEQSIAETQYDSLAIEAGYLAHGHSERADAAFKAKSEYESYFNRPFKKIEIGALVLLVDDAGQEAWYFIGPCFGGLKVMYKSKVIWTITLEAPLGRKIKGLEVGDDVDFNNNGTIKRLSVEKIL